MTLSPSSSGCNKGHPEKATNFVGDVRFVEEYMIQLLRTLNALKHTKPSTPRAWDVPLILTVLNRGYNWGVLESL